MLEEGHVYQCVLSPLLFITVCKLLKQNSTGKNSLRSQDCVMLSVPYVHTEIGKRAFVYSAPSAWNMLQNVSKLKDLISLNAFKFKMKELETDSLRCKCF